MYIKGLIRRWLGIDQEIAALKAQLANQQVLIDQMYGSTTVDVVLITEVITP